MQANRGISVKPLAAALTIALAAAGANAHAGSNGNTQIAARMQALHGLVAQLKQYRAAHPGKLDLFPHAPKHKITFPRQRHAPAVAAATLAVTNCVDDASSATTPGSLRYAVLNAADGDTIDLSACNASTITLTQGALPVAVDNLTITAGAGNHVTIDGGGTNQVIVNYGPGTTPPYVMAFRYLTVQDGATSGTGKYGIGGGCIISSNGVALYQSTVSGCSVNDPTGPALGGGVAAYGLYMYRSTITGNSVSTGNGTPPATGGAPLIAVGGGAFAKYAAVIYSHIDGNTATSNLGNGAVGGGLMTARPYLYASTISRNAVVVNAGSATGGSANVGSGGGLIAKYGGTLQSSTISGNRLTCTSASTTSLNTACVGAGVVNYHSSGGGGSSYPLAVYESTISGNAATCSLGGALCLAGGVDSKYGLNVVQSTISGNSAQIGAALMQKYSGTGTGASIYNSTIAANTAQDLGGGIYEYAGGASSAPPPITLVSSIVAMNSSGGVPDDIYLGDSYTLTIAGTNDLVMAASANITLPGGTLECRSHAGAAGQQWRSNPDHGFAGRQSGAGCRQQSRTVTRTTSAVRVFRAPWED